MTLKIQALILLLVKENRRMRVRQAIARLIAACLLTWLLTASVMPAWPSLVVLTPEPVFTRWGWLVTYQIGSFPPVESYHLTEAEATTLISILTADMLKGRTYL